jgi:hypothetical protein
VRCVGMELACVVILGAFAQGANTRARRKRELCGICGRATSSSTLQRGGERDLKGQLAIFCVQVAQG